MAKWSGKIGYVQTVEIEPGVWEEQITDRGPYYGELQRNTSGFQSSGGVNDNITISNNISVVADPYAYENFQHMKCIDFMGTKWEIVNIDVQYPRIILTLGGVYNGK